jgi:nickel-type superoxide dismutase maturation protease
VILAVRRVRGDSLAPRFRAGDFVVISRIPLLFRRPAAGDVVVFRQPDYGQLIKRVEQVKSDGSLFVLGDDIDSVDSRRFGPIQPKALIGLVVLHVPRAR